MLTVNMQKPHHPYNHRNHPQISKGVNTDQYTLRRPSLQELMMDQGIPGSDGPKHLADPFHFPDHQNEMLEFATAQAQYNSYGNFAVSRKMDVSRRRTMHRLRMDSEITGLVNRRRPKI